MASKHIWWDDSWNPVTGCNDDRISPGCDNCYAREMAEKRLRGKYGYPADEPFRVTVHPDKFNQPLHWKKPRRIFVCSMGDLFHKHVPYHVLCQVLWMAKQCPQHTFLICTKRADRMAYLMSREKVADDHAGKQFPLPNIHLGTTVEHQDTVDRIGHLLDAPAAVHWISFEPLLGPIHLGDFRRYLDWMVIGCETGKHRRHCHTQWVATLVDQAKAVGIPVWVKQMEVAGRVSYDPAEWPEWARLRQLPQEVR